MPLLSVIFKDGFSDDHAIVRVNGVKAFDRDNLRTRPERDRAAAFDIDVPPGLVTVEVDIPTRAQNLVHSLDVRARMSMLVRLVPGGGLRIESIEGVVGDL
ncbi:MAG: hypothetical protein SFZ23_13720 [Planctomycetota bacterium]|nr:hypothetical protein [Planctomycetota bacterium]